MPRVGLDRVPISSSGTGPRFGTHAPKIPMIERMMKLTNWSITQITSEMAIVKTMTTPVALRS
ncbi:hypothetical protein D3C83_195780 [compost metagenome]